ncbi:hypothetical protein [Lacipirellula sp.]|uniref:hypothetical protein n=1 Tax=Lacipirellula sp. TaxID=2691419 RepID=UPI003D0A162A
MSSQFAEYVFLRRRFWLAGAAFLLLALIEFAIFEGSSLLRVDDQPWVGLAAFAIAAVMVVCVVRAVIAWYRLLNWPCPQCNKLFLLAWWSSWPTDECKHCGLKVDLP